MKIFKIHAVPLLVYAVLVIGMTWPLAFNMKTSIYGFPHDNIGTLWRMWALDKAADEGIDPHKFDYVNYPEGIDLVGGHIPSPTSDGLIRVFGAGVQDKYVAYNLLTMFKFLICAYFFYLFAYSVTSNFLVSLACGFFFAFSPYMANLAKPYGPNFIPAFLPLAYLGLVRLLKKPGLRALLVFLALYALFFADNYYHSYFFSVSLALALLVFLLVPGRFGFNILQALKTKARGLRLSRAKLAVLALAGAAAVTAACLLYVDIAPHAANRQFAMSEAVMRSARPFLYFTPSITSTFLGHLSLRFVHENVLHCEYFEQTLYLGFVPVLLVLACLFLNRRLEPWKRKVFIFFFTLLVVSMLLAMGPYIPFNPFNYRFFETIQEYPHIVGPSWLFFKIAPMFRFLCRYQAITVFSLMACFAVSLDFFLSRLKRPALRAALLAVVCALVCVEYLDVHKDNTTNVWEHQPEVYKLLAEDNATYPIVEANDMDWPSRLHMLAYQVFHEKKIQQAAAKGHFFRVYDVFSPDVHGKFRDLGFKCLTVIRHFGPVTTPPLQIEWPRPSLADFPDQERLGCLRRVRDFKDSILYAFDADCLAEYTLGNVDFRGDFSVYESYGHNPEVHWRWCGNKGVLIFRNPYGKEKCVTLVSGLYTRKGAELTISYGGYAHKLTAPADSSGFTCQLRIPPKSQVEMVMETDSPPMDFPQDSRRLVFQLYRYEVEENTSCAVGCLP